MRIFSQLFPQACRTCAPPRSPGWMDTLMSAQCLPHLPAHVEYRQQSSTPRRVPPTRTREIMAEMQRAIGIRRPFLWRPKTCAARAASGRYAAQRRQQRGTQSGARVRRRGKKKMNGKSGRKQRAPRPAPPPPQPLRAPRATATHSNRHSPCLPLLLVMVARRGGGFAWRGGVLEDTGCI